MWAQRDQGSLTSWVRDLNSSVFLLTYLWCLVLSCSTSSYIYTSTWFTRQMRQSSPTYNSSWKRCEMFITKKPSAIHRVYVCVPQDFVWHRVYVCMCTSRFRMTSCSILSCFLSCPPPPALLTAASCVCRVSTASSNSSFSLSRSS